MTVSVQNIPAPKPGTIVRVPLADLDNGSTVLLGNVNLNPGKVTADGWCQLFLRIPGADDATEGTGDGPVVVHCAARVENGANNNAVGCAARADTNPQAGGTEWNGSYLLAPAGSYLCLGNPSRGGIPEGQMCNIRLAWVIGP